MLNDIDSKQMGALKHFMSRDSLTERQSDRKKITTHGNFTKMPNAPIF